MNSKNRFSSPKKPSAVKKTGKNVQVVDEWDKIKQLKEKKKRLTEEEYMEQIEQFKEQIDSSDSENSEEVSYERITSTPGNDSFSNSLKKVIPLEPFNLKEERECNLIDSKGNFTHKSFNSMYNDAWLMSLDENISDPKMLKDRKTTFEYVYKKRMSEDSSIISGDDKDIPENFKKKKIESIKSTLLQLLQSGESPNQAIKRYRACLPKKVIPKPFKKNIRKLAQSKFLHISVKIDLFEDIK